MKHEFMQKINKMGKIGHTISKICSVILYIATVCCIVGGVLLALVPRTVLWLQPVIRQKLKWI